MSRTAAFLVVVATYGVALAVGIVTGWALDGVLHPLAVAFLADVAATLVVFVASLITRNASLYDPYWSVAPPILAAYFLWVPADVAANPVRPLLVLLLVSIWAVRLTMNWGVGWTGMEHVDWRYRMLKERSGALYPLVNLTGIQLFPTVLVFLGCLALWPALRSPAPLGLLDALAAVVTLGSIVIEGVADIQMRRFARTRTDPQQLMDRGLWGWSRHPNYLGEIGFWFGLWLFALATGLDAAWTAVGWVVMVLLFVFISIPMMERRQRERKPAFAELQRRIPMLLPWRPPRRS